MVRHVARLADMPPDIASFAAERLHSLALLTDRLRGDMVTWTEQPPGAFRGHRGRKMGSLACCEEAHRCRTTDGG